MTTAIATITQDIYALRENFQLVAVDRSINFDKEAGFAIQILSGNDYAMKIAMNNRQSVADAVTNVAAIGISLNPATRQAYLVPRKDKICLDISYIGLIDLAVKTGSVLWAQSNVVRENDSFVINGFDKPPTHSHDPFAKAEVRGPITGAYVVVKTPDGEYLTHTMDIGAIHATRDRSESWKAYVKDNSKKTPWITDEPEMTKKTVVKQAWKYWPKTDKTDRVSEAIQLLNTEGGEGFDRVKPGIERFPENALQDWVSKAHEATSQADLTDIWKAGVVDINKSKDLEAYGVFKSVVMECGAALKNAPTDVEPKPVTPQSKIADEGNPF